MKIKKTVFHVIVLLFMIVMFTSCKQDPELDRGLKTFFATVYFMFSMIMSGVPAIVFSALNVKSDKQTIKVLAIVFTSVFGLFSLIAFRMYYNLWSVSTGEWLTFLSLMQGGTVMTCITLLIVKGATKNQLEEITDLDRPTNPIKTGKNIEEEDELAYLDKFLEDDLDEG